MGRTAQSTRKRLAEYVRHRKPVRLRVEDLEPTANLRHLTEPKKQLRGRLYRHSLAPDDFAFQEDGEGHGQFVSDLESVRMARDPRIRRLPEYLREGGTRRKRRTRRKRGTKRSTSRRR